jgi:hypothetical protein
MASWTQEQHLSLFKMGDGLPVDNKQPATNPLTVNLPDGRQVKSTHTCNLVVPGLPRPILGHIVPNLAIASLFGIRRLCNAGCIVVFDKDKCTVWYDGKIILISPQNLSTDLWMLPFWSNNTMLLPSAVPRPNALEHPAMALFMHSVRTRHPPIIGQYSYFHFTQGGTAGFPQRMSKH